MLQHLSHRKLDKSSIAREKLNLCTRTCEEGRYTLLNVLEDARFFFGLVFGALLSFSVSLIHFE